MNLVACFFADLAQDCVRGGSFASVKELTEEKKAAFETHDTNVS